MVLKKHGNGLKKRFLFFWFVLYFKAISGPPRELIFFFEVRIRRGYICNFLSIEHIMTALRAIFTDL